MTHGFRSSFRDYAAEQTHTPHAVMEAALAHTIKNKAEAAYARSDGPTGPFRAGDRGEFCQLCYPVTVSHDTGRRTSTN